MKNSVLGWAAICSIFIASSCNNVNDSEAPQKVPAESETPAKPLPAAENPEVTVIKYEQLQSRLQQQNDTVYVVNFWATWCGPCVKELPHFKSFSDRMAKEQKPFRLIMVSLDQSDILQEKVVPFLKERNINAQHYLLDDNTRMNEWIPKFDATWSGAIPATIVYENGAKRAFHEGSMDEKGLTQLLQSYVH